MMYCVMEFKDARDKVLEVIERFNKEHETDLMMSKNRYFLFVGAMMYTKYWEPVIDDIYHEMEIEYKSEKSNKKGPLSRSSAEMFTSAVVNSRSRQEQDNRSNEEIQEKGVCSEVVKNGEEDPNRS